MTDLTQPAFKEEPAVHPAVDTTDDIIDDDDYDEEEVEDEKCITIEESARRFQSMLDKRRQHLKEEKQIKEELGYQCDEDEKQKEEETGEPYR